MHSTHISSIAHGPEGWIVSGTLLSTGRSGAMALGSDPPRVLLAGQGVEVLTVGTDHLLVRGFWNRKGWIYRVPHGVAAELGASLVPFDAGALSAIAAVATRAAELHSPGRQSVATFGSTVVLETPFMTAQSGLSTMGTNGCTQYCLRGGGWVFK